MAKRFINSELFDEKWFSDLSKDGKLFYFYYLTKCDNAGILKLNQRLFEFQTGIKDWVTVREELGNRYLTVGENILFMPEYLKLQYPDFPKSKVHQQVNAIKILREFGLWDESNNKVYLTVTQQLPNDYPTTNVNGNVNTISDGIANANDGGGDDDNEIQNKKYEYDNDTLPF